MSSGPVGLVQAPRQGGAGILKAAWGVLGRIYNDYAMPGRWGEYRGLLLAAQSQGYQFVRHQDAEAALAGPAPRLFFLRHDIDSDLALARTMFSIERELGIRSTYYFRLSTMDPVLMREILAQGGEVGYHYEEVSDDIKAQGIRDPEAVLQRLDLVREAFLRNLRAFEDQVGGKVLSVAAHGDHANRALGISNRALMDDRLRAAAGIRLEAYDAVLGEQLSFRGSDAMYPGLWTPSSPMRAVLEGSPRVLVLVHPRQWQSAPFVRFRLDARRLVEEIRPRWR